MFSKILAPIDGSELSIKAAKRASQLARVHSAELCLLHVVPLPLLDLLSYRGSMVEGDSLSKELEGRLSRQADDYLEAASAVCEVPVRTHKVMGHPSEAIVDFLEKEGFDLVVIGNRGLGGVASLLLGSVSAHVVHHCKVPVLIVK